MKVIITGATGFVGTALIKQCISNPAITSAIILSRRPLDKNISNNPKIQLIIHEDFTKYPPELLDQLKDAQCCLWAIGGRATKFSSVEEMHRAQHDTTLAAAEAFAEYLAPHMGEGSKFRFVFCSGKFTEWDQHAKLWFMSDSRKSKGFVEKGLFDVVEVHKDKFEVFCIRPGGILPGGSGVAHALHAKIMFGIGIDTLALAICKIAVDGYEKHTIENNELLVIGQA